VQPYVQLLRPVNCLIASAGTLVGVVVEGSLSALTGQYAHYIPAALSAFLITGAGNTLNDYQDRKTDTVNHPERPIPSGRVAPEAALRCAWALFAAGLLASIFTFSTYCYALAAVNTALLVAYEYRVKATGLPGNITVSWLSASVFLYGALAVSDGRSVLVLLGMAFLASLAREVHKDMEDLEGDRAERRTLPMRMGMRASGAVSAGLLVGAVLLSPLPVLTGMFGAAYLPAVLCADAIFIYCAGITYKDPGRAAKLEKLGMVVALLAFVAGGVSVEGV